MSIYLLHHQHEPHECAAAYAAWAGFKSPLRHRPASSNCLTGGHVIWWRVEASNSDDALGLLPAYLAARTEAIEVREVDIP